MFALNPFSLKQCPAVTGSPEEGYTLMLILSLAVLHEARECMGWEQARQAEARGPSLAAVGKLVCHSTDIGITAWQKTGSGWS